MHVNYAPKGSVEAQLDTLEQSLMTAVMSHHARILDLFREWDLDSDGLVSRQPPSQWCTPSLPHGGAPPPSLTVVHPLPPSQWCTPSLPHSGVPPLTR